MDRDSLSQDRKGGLLYVVATPIGNLEDITLRALRVLKEVDLIVAENGTHTRRLCVHYGIKTKITTYNQHSRKSRTERLVEKLETGMNMALVSDAGTPGISDPGITLITGAIEKQIQITPIPGPSAAVASLSVCGFSTGDFCFSGFLSNRAGKRKKELEGLVSEKRTMVFYESPHRIRATLSDMAGIFGPRQMALFREMTKIFEEIRRGTPAELLEGLTLEKTRGEFTLVVSGKVAGKDSKELNSRTLDAIEGFLKEGTMSVRDIAGVISEKEKLAYRKVYKECLARKRVLKDS
jgi:16S rRNA (cytidine1402-2'-O)-methyltransferase